MRNDLGAEFLRDRRAKEDLIEGFDRTRIGEINDELDNGTVDLYRDEVRILMQPVFQPNETPLESVVQYTQSDVQYVLFCQKIDERMHSTPLDKYRVHRLPIRVEEVNGMAIKRELNGDSEIWMPNQHTDESPVRKYPNVFERFVGMYPCRSIVDFERAHTMVHRTTFDLSGGSDVASLFDDKSREALPGIRKKLGKPVPINMNLPIAYRGEVGSSLPWMGRIARRGPYIFSLDDETQVPKYPANARQESRDKDEEFLNRLVRSTLRPGKSHST